jgi:hypothetical protein
MVVTRKVDREAINLQRQGQLGVYASCMGQEAAQVGSAYALGDDDWIFPSYRELGAALVREVDAAGLLHLYRGTWLSDHDPYEHNFALMSIPIGTQALHATGFAMGARFDGNPIVTMTYFGDGGTSEGDPHEAMTFAGVMKAPVIFFVQNNQYAISVPLEKQTAAPTLAHKAIGYGLPGYRCDGNDVLATYAVTRRAVERARERRGADVHRGADLPDGGAHHLRRPVPLPHPGGARRGGQDRPDRADAQLPDQATCTTTRSRRRSRSRPRTPPASARRHLRRAARRPDGAVRARLRRPDRPLRGPARAAAAELELDEGEGGR